MTTQLESDLRSALSSCAADVPADAVERVRGAAYQPRRRSQRVRLAVGGVGVVAIATAGGLAVGLAGPASQGAFAEWSADPTAPAPGQDASATSACMSQANKVGDSFATSTSMPIVSLIQGAAGTWQSVLDDTRGPYTLVALQAPTAAGTLKATCLSGPGDLSTSPKIFILGPPAAGTVPDAGGFGESTWNANPSTGVTTVLGDVGSAVTGVTLTLSDGSTVAATVGDGFYVAWWPSDVSPVTATATSPSGTVTYTFGASANQAAVAAGQAAAKAAKAASSGG